MDDRQSPSDSEPPEDRQALSRRTLLKGAAVAGGTLLGGGVALAALAGEKSAELSGAGAGRTAAGGSQARGESASVEGGRNGGGTPHGTRRSGPGPYKHSPNILVVIVDQLRAPAWFTAAGLVPRLMPNLARLRRDAVSFDGHYAASNDCTPARSTLLTGLYTHQTGCMITSGSTLSPAFPTWGTMLRELGYSTWWYGKWHLTHRDNHWRLPADAGALERYGFAGGTYPSPDGGPGQGWRADPEIVRQFKRWIRSSDARSPWCTTVSFVNPHDIAWWYRWSDRFTHEASAPKIVKEMPRNFETPEEMEARGKPLLQLSHIDTSDVSFGRVPFAGPGVREAWTPFFDLYLKLAHQVDKHVGAVLAALRSKPSIAENTIVLFTSDHGEYGGSHGMRGKGGGAYEEGIHVPLLVNDLRAEKATRAPRAPRRGLTSSVDVAPLLVDLAVGSKHWRRDSRHSHLAHRHDMIRMLADPRAPGRGHILHATDEIVTEFAVRVYAAQAPLHVTAIKTAQGKLVLYSRWRGRSVEPLHAGQEGELYDASTEGGRLELQSEYAAGSALEARLRSKLSKATRLELHQTLPLHLRHAHREGFRDYYDTAADAAEKATARRAKLLERLEEGQPLGGGLRTMLHRQRSGNVGVRS